MKKTVKPSPILLILSAVIMVIAIIGTVISLKNSYGISASDGILGFLAIALTVFSVYNYITADRIEFDENFFTVDGNTYSYADISDVKVDSEMVLRNISTLRIDVYVGESLVCSFTKNGKGAKEFIECMKNQGVVVNIQV